MGSRERQLPLEGFGQNKGLDMPKRRRKSPKVLSEKQRSQLSAQIWADEVKPIIDESREQWVSMQSALVLDRARQDVEEMPPEIDMDRLDDDLTKVVLRGRHRGLTSMDFVRPLRKDTHLASSQSPHLAPQIERHEARTIQLIEKTYQNTEAYSKRLQRNAHQGKAKLGVKVA